MMKTLLFATILCGWCSLASAAALRAQASQEKSTKPSQTDVRDAAYLDRLYEHAIKDAQVIKRSELSDRLWSVEDPWVDRKKDSLVAVLFAIKKEDLAQWVGKASHQTPDSWEKAVWVTLSPELSMALNQQGIIADSASVNLRIKQLLGLPPRDEYCYIAQCWVPISGLVRPTPDPDVRNHFSTVTFPKPVDTAHRAWIEQLRNTSHTTTTRRPWTSLGYTYDWGNSSSPIGLSEFVIRPGTTISITLLATLWYWYLHQVDYPTELFIESQAPESK